MDVAHFDRHCSNLGPKGGDVLVIGPGVGGRGRRGGAAHGGAIYAHAYPAESGPPALGDMNEVDDSIVRLLRQTGHTVAVAESLTGGTLSSRLAQRPRASEWFRGGVVAYSSEVKHRVLGVRPGPVVSREAAIDMARGVGDLLGSSVAVAVTGVAGPQPQDGIPPGTVWVAVTGEMGSATACLELSGTPAEIVDRTCQRSIELLEQQLKPTD